jgi:chromate transporter
VPESWRRAAAHWRWVVYALLGGIAAATVGPWLVLVLLGCGVVEVLWQRPDQPGRVDSHLFPLAAAGVVATGGLLALVWVAFKVGALAYGGGFVIIPLMQADAVDAYHWMTNTEFLNAVALGQVTPGPVTHTVAVVGYAAYGIGGGLLAALIAFLPSFSFVLLGARRFDALRNNARVRAFLGGAGPAAIGAIIGVAIPLAFALDEWWQLGVLAGAAVALFVLRRGVVTTLLGAGVVGVVAALLGAPLP